MNQYSLLLTGAWWSVVTIGVYGASKWLHRRHPRAWLAPMIVAPVLLVLVAGWLRVNYGQYQSGTHWLLALFAPATVAFALPVYEQRALIRKYWPLLVAGAVAGSLTAMIFSWLVCDWLGLGAELRLSLLPRSVSTPFAVFVSGQIGGTPPLTAVFVLVTGIFGATVGEVLLQCVPVRSAVARGALLGMGAHGFGAAKAQQLDREAGAIAGLVMVFGGLLNVLAAPLLALWVRAHG